MRRRIQRLEYCRINGVLRSFERGGLESKMLARAVDHLDAEAERYQVEKATIAAAENHTRGQP